MKEAPEPVLLYIPLMKELNLSWSEIKSTPRFELEGLLLAFGEHSRLHSMDGYDSEDINDMAMHTSTKNIKKIIDENTCSGLEAEFKLKQWSKI